MPQDVAKPPTTAISSEVGTPVAIPFIRRRKGKPEHLYKMSPERREYSRLANAKHRAKQAEDNPLFNLRARPGKPTLLRQRWDIALCITEKDFVALMKEIGENRYFRCKSYWRCLSYAAKVQEQFTIGDDGRFTFSCKGCRNMPEREKEG